MLTMFGKYFAATVICFIALVYVEVSAKTEKDLWRHLFEGQEYDKLFRPVKNASTAVSVSVGLVPIQRIRQRYPYSTPFEVEVDFWLIVEWKDEYLTWDPKDFDNIQQLILPVSKVWSPKLSSYPGHFKISFLSNETSDVSVRFDGTVSWITANSALGWYIKPEKGDSYFLISIISWTHDDSQMNIDINSKVNENLSGASLKKSKEFRTFSWSKKSYPIIHFSLG